MKEIELTQGKYAIVDDADYASINKYKWYASKYGGTYYALRKERSGFRYKTIYMHRVIMFASGDAVIDHINGNGLDNRKKNLRACDHSQNMQNSRTPKNNTSGFKGVSWHKKSQKWEAKIYVGNKKIYIGTFSNKVEAALAYDNKARELHGKFAKTNF